MNKESVVKILKNNTVILVMIVLAVIFTIGNPAFLTMNNFITILRQSSILATAGVGLTFVMIAGGVNLAVGSVVSIVTVLVALCCVNWGIHWAIGMVLAVLVATVCGWFTGFSIVKGRIAPMIGSLAVKTILGGVAYIICGGLPVYGIPQESKVLGQGYIGFVPVPVILFLIVAVVAAFVLNKTYLGRYFYAAGSNDEAARLSGINTQKIRILAYTISGFLAGIAGIIMYGRVGSGQPIAGNEIEMNGLSAVVIGGVSMAGGEGKIFKACCGCVLISMLTNGLTLMNISEYVQMVIRGSIFLGAVILDSYQHRAKQQKVVHAAPKEEQKAEGKA